MRVWPLALIATVVFVGPAPAYAEVLLETIVVDPASRTPAEGKVTLQQGTRYLLEVSGTQTTTGPEGAGSEHDALYCFREIKTPANTSTGNYCDPPFRSENFKIGVASDPRWGAIDQFATASEPYTGSSHLRAYDPNHSYTVSFVAPATGVLKAGGVYAIRDCSKCETAVSGSFTIKIFDPAGGGSEQPDTPPQGQRERELKECFKQAYKEIPEGSRNRQRRLASAHADCYRKYGPKKPGLTDAERKRELKECYRQAYKEIPEGSRNRQRRLASAHGECYRKYGPKKPAPSPSLTDAERKRELKDCYRQAYKEIPEGSRNRHRRLASAHAECYRKYGPKKPGR